MHAEDLDATVQAGVTRKQLNAHLRDTGLFFPIDPGADATIGGMTATRASGTNAVRYGTMKENVLGLTVVMADGRVIRTGGRARKSSAGYDLTRLFVGSEGTLGIITEITVKLYGVPEAISSAVCNFPGVDEAVRAVIATIQTGIPVARIELLDEEQMRGCIGFSKLEGYRVAPTLFYEFHGTEAGVREQAEQAQAIAQEFGGQDFQWATRAEERNRLWQARHDSYYAALSLRPGAVGWPTDVCVPISRLGDCIRETRVDLAEAGMLAPIAGHVGDGNFHLLMLIDPKRPEELATAEKINKRLVRRAIAMGGTCTGEHGVGYGKIDSLAEEAGPAVEVMAAIKRDPRSRRTSSTPARLSGSERSPIGQRQDRLVQQGVAAGQHIEIVGVAAADDAGQWQAAGAHRVENDSARARLGPRRSGPAGPGDPRHAGRPRHCRTRDPAGPDRARQAAGFRPWADSPGRPRRRRAPHRDRSAACGPGSWRGSGPTG